MFSADFVWGLSTTVGLLIIGHWFPWPRRLHRLLAYTYGLASILAGAALWLLRTGQGGIVIGLGIIAVASGVTTVSCWGIDWVLRLWARSHIK